MEKGQLNTVMKNSYFILHYVEFSYTVKDTAFSYKI